MQLGFAWFLTTALLVCVCICVCVCLLPWLLITSGMIWIPYNWLHKFYNFYMAAVVNIIGSIVSQCGLCLSVDTLHRHNQICLSYHYISHYFHFNCHFKWLTRQSASFIKVRLVYVHEHYTYIEAFKRRASAGLGYR